MIMPPYCSIIPLVIFGCRIRVIDRAISVPFAAVNGDYIIISGNIKIYFPSNDVVDDPEQMIYPALCQITGYKLSMRTVTVDNKYPALLKKGDKIITGLFGEASTEQRLDD
jgi:hypothetical protein